ncbi:MAG: gfo/Idh/MocA family oxidoreductase, partial [Bacteroidaceae bacterium]|nr:gfo/Idh/MocA family oxidoreductase [Bacteroidaceae bacterium]
RYAPAVQILRKRLDKEHLISYDLHYLTGNYPEGNALLDLYIHPLDLVCHLFGKPEILVCQQVASASYILMLRHPHIVGTLELSTSYTWTSAGESLKVCTSKGIYRLSQMELLTFEPKHSSILGIPYEKVHKHNKTIEYLYARNNFTPIFPNNQIYSQGYYSEIQSFITSIEHGHSSILTDIASIKPTYEVLTRIKRLFAESN